MTAHGTIEVTAHGTPNQKSLSEVFFENPPPPPTGGNGSDLKRPEPSHVSTEILQRMSKELGKGKTLAYLRALRPNQPVPEFLLGEGTAEQASVNEEPGSQNREESSETDPPAGLLGVPETEEKGNYCVA